MSNIIFYSIHFKFFSPVNFSVCLVSLGLFIQTPSLPIQALKTLCIYSAKCKCLFKAYKMPKPCVQFYSTYHAYSHLYQSYLHNQCLIATTIKVAKVFKLGGLAYKAQAVACSHKLVWLKQPPH